jgi:hypothetical protein
MPSVCSPKELSLIRLLAYVADRFFADCCFDWSGTCPATLTDHTRERFGIEAADFELIPGLLRRGLVEEGARNAWNATQAGRDIANFETELTVRGSVH